MIEINNVPSAEVEQTNRVLIPLTENKNGDTAVSAKELYLFLGSDLKNWSRWYQKNIEENDFATEGVDYQTFFTMKNGNETKDFALSITFAKKIAMMSRTEKGEQARDYFIECEKKLNTVRKSMTTLEVLQEIIADAVAKEKRLREIERTQQEYQEQISDVLSAQQVQDSRLLEVESKIKTKDTSYYTVTGYANLVGRKVPRDVAAKLGRQCSSMCKTRRVLKGTEYDAKYGEVGTYPKHILEECFNSYFSD